MYTEIFRITKSVWPLVIMHTMEDAVINPLLLLGFVSVEKIKLSSSRYQWG